jgi:DNA polymerase III delta subunit
MVESSFSMPTNNTKGKKQNLFLLMGENDYDLKKFLQKWIRSSLEKYGEYNVTRYDFDTKSVSELLGELNAPPFFGDGKRIFFLENFPPPPPSRPFSQKRKAEIADLQDAILTLPEETVLVMAVSKPDKRTSAYKKISPIISRTYDFPSWQKDNTGSLSIQGLSDATEWVLEQFALASGKILPAAAQFLVKYCGADPWKLSSEIEKLIAFSLVSQRPISEQDIHHLCLPSEEMANFAFSNAVQTGDVNRILGVLHKLFSSGEAPQAIFNRELIPTIRQLLQVRLALDFQKSAKDIGIHPFVFGKLKGIAKALPLDMLQKVHSTLLQIDIDSKTGVMTLSPEKDKIFRLRIERELLSLFTK